MAPESRTGSGRCQRRGHRAPAAAPAAGQRRRWPPAARSAPAPMQREGQRPEPRPLQHPAPGSRFMCGVNFWHWASIATPSNEWGIDKQALLVPPKSGMRSVVHRRKWRRKPQKIAVGCIWLLRMRKQEAPGRTGGGTRGRTAPAAASTTTAPTWAAAPSPATETATQIRTGFQRQTCLLDWRPADPF